ncbi:alpha/beta fold hydrolase [Amycolatopsis sp. GM8]|uniref:alpha/beta fold hydrolase n=1 Tax=Amycolatopsis sp. GM8 TaxID=2896530 RepID=UPI001F2F6DAF|nr:alpha/beta hydrolase [Amycolatopsis sp. GM8]
MAEEFVSASDGCRLWTSKAGSGAPVVFLHGGPGWWDIFADLADALAPVAVVCRWDQRGCGRSERRGPYTLDRTLADLDELRAHFGFSEMALVGHSWGADLALRYAMAFPARVTHLVLMCTAGPGSARYRRRLRGVLAPHQERISELVRSAPSAERNRALLRLRISFGFANQRTALHMADQLTQPYSYNDDYEAALTADTEAISEHALAEAYRALDIPTLLLHGAEDLHPPEVTDGLLAALPKAHRTVIDGAAHYPWLEQPEPTATTLREFLCGI